MLLLYICSQPMYIHSIYFFHIKPPDLVGNKSLPKDLLQRKEQT